MGERSLIWLRRAGWTVLGLLLAGGFVALIVSVFGGHTTPQRRAITTVTRVILPPPPPPPPPLPPKEPPPPEKQTLVQAAPKLAEPKPTQAPPRPAAKPSPSAAAKPGTPLTAAAGAGPNNYGLGVGNGGGDTIGGQGGGGGGGGGDTYGWYAGVIQSQVQVALRRDDRTRGGRYRAAISVWLNAAGQVTRTQIVSFSGDSGLEAAVAQALSGLSMGQAPPEGMPQPVHLRIAAQAG
jgi:TonB family protein